VEKCSVPKEDAPRELEGASVLVDSEPKEVTVDSIAVPKILEPRPRRSAKKKTQKPKDVSMSVLPQTRRSARKTKEVLKRLTENTRKHEFLQGIEDFGIKSNIFGNILNPETTSNSQSLFLNPEPSQTTPKEKSVKKKPNARITRSQKASIMKEPPASPPKRANLFQKMEREAETLMEKRSSSGSKGRPSKDANLSWRGTPSKSAHEPSISGRKGKKPAKPKTAKKGAKIAAKADDSIIDVSSWSGKEFEFDRIGEIGIVDDDDGDLEFEVDVEMDTQSNLVKRRYPIRKRSDGGEQMSLRKRKH
jgi:hypothetical protein